MIRNLDQISSWLIQVFSNWVIMFTSTEQRHAAENIWGRKPSIWRPVLFGFTSHLKQTENKSDRFQGSVSTCCFFIFLFCVCNILVSWFPYYLGTNTSGTLPHNCHFQLCFILMYYIFCKKKK